VSYFLDPHNQIDFIRAGRPDLREKCEIPKVAFDIWVREFLTINLP
jgi:hypothetical protein